MASYVKVLLYEAFGDQIQSVVRHGAVSALPDGAVQLV